MVNSTVSGNTCKTDGGGIYNYVGGTATLTNVTITQNRADSDDNGGTAGGLYSNPSGAPVTLNNTIVAGNFVGTGTTADDIQGAVNSSSSFNLVGDSATAGGLTDKSTDPAHGNIVGNAGTETNTSPACRVCCPTITIGRTISETISKVMPGVGRNSIGLMKPSPPGG